MKSLTKFIQSNPDPRELKRALAVQMIEQNYRYSQIKEALGVSVGFISTCRSKFESCGIEGLLLKHRGSQGYLTWQQRQEVIDWLQQKNNWQLSELQTQLEVEYSVVFSSLQSYYSLFHDAGISWKKSQKSNSCNNPELVAQKKLKLKLGWRRIETKLNQVD